MLKYKDLIERLTIDQKITLLISKNMYKTNGLSSFDIPSIDIDNQASSNKKRTIFPGLRTIGNTWNSQILKEYGEASGIEGEGNIVHISVQNIFSTQSCLNANLLDSYIYGIHQSSSLLCLEGSFDWTDSNIEAYYPSLEQAVVRRKPDALIAGQQLLQRLEQLNYSGLVMSIQNREDLIILSILYGASIIFTTNDDADNVVKRALDSYESAKAEMNQQQLTKLMNDGIAISEDILNERLDALLDFILAYKKSNSAEQFNPVYHNSIAKKIAQEGSVLLKNDMILPLSYKTRVALIGSAVENVNEQASFQESFLSAASCYDANIIGYAHGYYLDHKDNTQYIASAEKLAVEADAAIVYIELSDYEKEIPQDYMRLLAALCMKNRKPIVLLISNTLVDMSFLKYTSALIWCASGQASSSALLDLIYGAVNPCGRLTEEYDFAKDARFEFGFGLSYSYFSYSKLKLTNAGAEFEIKNESDYDGYDVPQLYISEEGQEKRLKGYVKIFLKSKEIAKAFIPFDSNTFSTYQENTKDFKIIKGEYNIFIGRSIEDIELEATISINNCDSTIDNVQIDCIDETISLQGDTYKPLKQQGYSMSLRVVLFVYFLLALYINFTCIYYMATFEAVGKDPTKIIAGIFIAIVDIGLLVLAGIAIAKRKKAGSQDASYTLTSILDNTSEFEELARVEYDEPASDAIQEEAIQEEELAPATKQYHIDDEMDEESFNSLKQNDTISFDLIYNDIMCILKENAIGIEPSTLRCFIAALSSSKTMYITTSAFEELFKFLNVICVYFDVPFYYTDITGCNSDHDILWEEEDEQYVLSNFSRSVLAAEAMKNHLSFTCITGASCESIGMLNSIWKTYLSGNLNLEQENNVKYEGNISRIIIVDDYSLLTCLRRRDYEESTYLDITPFEIPQEELNREYMSLGYTLFMDSIADARKSHYLDEKYWKKLDDLEEEIKKARDFNIGNKLTLQMEVYSSVLLSLTSDEKEVLDFMLAQNLVFFLLSLDSRSNNQILQIIDRIFAEDETAMVKKYIKKILSSKEE